MSFTHSPRLQQITTPILQGGRQDAEENARSANMTGKGRTILCPTPPPVQA